MHRNLLPLLFLASALLAEPTLANKFETIGGGVSGLSREKILLLKEIVYYAGGFLLFLGVMALVTRNRFEGFVGIAGKGPGAATKGGIAMMVIGGVLIGLSFL